MKESNLMRVRMVMAMKTTMYKWLIQVGRW